MLQRAAVFPDEVIFLIRQPLILQLLPADHLKAPRERSEACQIFAVGRIQNSIYLKPVCRLLCQLREAAIDLRLRLHIAAVIQLLRRPTAHLRHNLLGIEYRVVLELGKAARIGFQRFCPPLIRCHERRISSSLFLQKGIERVQPSCIEALRPQLLRRFLYCFSEHLHLLRIACVSRIALLRQNGQRRLGAERRRHIQHIRQHPPFSLCVFPALVEHQLLHHGRVQRKSLPHEAEALSLFRQVSGSIRVDHRNGVDLRRGEHSDLFDIALEGGFIQSQLIHIRNRAVGGLDCRQILIIAKIVADARKERGHSVDSFPVVQCRIVQRQCDQQRRAVHILLLLREIDLPVPHHRAEICLQCLVAFIVAARLELGIIQKIFRYSTRSNTLCCINGRQLLLSNILHLLRYLDFRILERCTHRKIRCAALCRILPRCPCQCIQLCGRCAQHISAQRLQLCGKLLLFRPIQKQAEIQVIGVHHGIYRYKIRDLQIAIPFIAAEKLGIKIRLDHKQILRKDGFGRVGKPVPLHPFQICDLMQVPGYTVIRHGCSRLRVSGRETEKLWPRRRLCRSRRSRCRAAYRQCPHLSVFLPLRELIYKYRAGHDQHQRNRCNGKRFCCLVSMPLFTSGGCVCAAIWAAALIFPEFFSALWAKHDTASFSALLFHLFYNLSLPYSRNSGKTNPEKRFLPA